MCLGSPVDSPLILRWSVWLSLAGEAGYVAELNHLHVKPAVTDCEDELASVVSPTERKGSPFRGGDSTPSAHSG